MKKINSIIFYLFVIWMNGIFIFFTVKEIRLTLESIKSYLKMQTHIICIKNQQECNFARKKLENTPNMSDEE